MVFRDQIMEFYGSSGEPNFKKLEIKAKVGGVDICITHTLLNEKYGLSVKGRKNSSTLAEAKEAELGSIIAMEGEILAGNIKKNQLKDEYQRIADIFAKVIENCTFSLDNIPMKRYHAMIAVHNGMKVNWAVFMWYILADHVDLTVFH